MDVFSAIAAPTRRALLQRIASREMPVSELAESFEMTLSAISQHLAVLRQAGLVSQHKQGKQRIYRLNPEPLRQVAEWLEFYEPFWTGKLRDLGTYLDEKDQDS
jgi:DNA-binding transcriptional ArsR family regulator